MVPILSEIRSFVIAYVTERLNDSVFQLRARRLLIGLFLINVFLFFINGEFTLQMVGFYLLTFFAAWIFYPIGQVLLFRDYLQTDDQSMYWVDKAQNLIAHLIIISQILYFTLMGIIIAIK